jgi:hypothetical protein
MKLFEQFIESTPVVTLSLTAPVQPFKDNVARMMVEGTQHVDIAGYSVVVEVSEQLGTETIVLLRKWFCRFRETKGLHKGLFTYIV